MNPFSKIIIALLLNGSLIFINVHGVSADYRKKISLYPLTDSANWKESYSAGQLIEEMIRLALMKGGEFHIIDTSGYPSKKMGSGLKGAPMMPPEKEGAGPAGSMGMDGTMESKEPMESSSEMTAGDKTMSMKMLNPTQFMVKGRVLSFAANKPKQHRTGMPENMISKNENAEIEVEINLIKSHSKKIIASKKFKYSSSDGRDPYINPEEGGTIDNEMIGNSSMGLVLLNLRRNAAFFIVETLKVYPLDGEIISVDESQEEAVINLGRINGVKVRDLFLVFSVESHFVDPLNQMDLGEKLNRKGVVKVREVQENFSRVAIMAGKGFASGDLVRSKKNQALSKIDPATFP